MEPEKVEVKIREIDLNAQPEMTTTPIENSRARATMTEDCLQRLDYILKSYQTEGHFDQENTHSTFWRYYQRCRAQQPSSLLLIPPKVRGLLSSTMKLDREFQDQLFLIKFQQGITTEVAYVGPRIVANMIWEVETKKVWKWVWSNKSSLRVWLFVSAFLLFCGAFLQIWADFAMARVWRALLMELVMVIAFFIMLIEAKTPFLEACVRKPLETQSLVIQQSYYRSFFYAIVVFFSAQYWTVRDIPVLIGCTSLGIFTLCLFFMRKDLYNKFYIAKRKIATIEKLEQLFQVHDEDRDSVLNSQELSNFFESIGIKLWNWQKELIFWEYDTMILGGLRVEDLTYWFYQD